MRRPIVLICAGLAVAGVLGGSSGALASAVGIDASVSPGKVLDGTVGLRLEDAYVVKKDGAFVATLYDTSVAELQLSGLTQPAYVRCKAEGPADLSLKVEEYMRVGNEFKFIVAEDFDAFPSTIEILADPDPAGDYVYRMTASNTWSLSQCTVETI